MKNCTSVPRGQLAVRTCQRPATVVRSLAVFAALAVAGGCQLGEWMRNGFKVGPEYGRPAPTVASSWIDGAGDRIETSPAQLSAWWTSLNDPALDSLIRRTYEQNLSLRVAASRVLEARYRRRIAVGELFPQSQEADVVYTRNKLSSNQVAPPPAIWFSDWTAGLHASWELDFWGRFRRAVEAADAELDASVENYDDVLVLLLAETATAYVDLRTAQARLRYAQDNVASQEQALDLANQKLQFGTATERDVRQAETVLEATRALIPRFETAARTASNRLCVLVGLAPLDLAAELGPAAIPVAPPQVAIGIPADLVRRRPDVRRAEREVAAQSARIGIAQSDLYPHITLNGTFGVAAEHFSDLFDGSRSSVAGIGPALRWDVLNYGRLINNVRVQDARFQELAYRYQEQVLTAGREVEDAIERFRNSHDSAKSLQASADAAARTVEITLSQYREGAVEFTAVFLAASELAQRQDEAAEAKGAIAQSLIELYRALGGGWEIRLGPVPADRLVAPLPPPAE